VKRPPKILGAIESYPNVECSLAIHGSNFRVRVWGATAFDHPPPLGKLTMPTFFGSSILRLIPAAICEPLQGSWRALVAAFAISFLSPSLFASAQDRTSLPLPDPPFEGKINETFKGSEEDWPKPVTPPAGAPNVVVILLDDVGFGQPGTFGGPVPTPNIDKLASQGLRYDQFHTTAIARRREQPF